MTRMASCDFQNTKEAWPTGFPRPRRRVWFGHAKPNYSTGAPAFRAKAPTDKHAPMHSSWRDHFLEALITAAYAADDRRLASRRGELQDGTRASHHPRPGIEAHSEGRA